MERNAEQNNETNEAELKREVEENSRRENFCERTVVLALVFEAVVLLQYSANKPPLETALLSACSLLLAVAIYGEITFGSKRSKAHAELQRISDQKVAASNERAAEANRKAEEASLELAKYREPRVLNQEQIDRVAARLREFPGVQFASGVASMDPEFFMLLLLLEAILDRAGWVATDWRIGPGLTRPGKSVIGIGVSAYGVIVGIPLPVPVPAEMPAIVHAGAALIFALQTEGVGAMSHVMQPEPRIIHIMIGRKP